jgi:hypothetical protein
MTPRRGLVMSYARADAPIALGVYELFADAGEDIWLDLANLEPGLDWWEGVRRAIDQSFGVVFLVSDESSRSMACSQELAYAIACGKRIVPIAVEPAAQYEGWKATRTEGLCPASKAQPMTSPDGGGRQVKTSDGDVRIRTLRTVAIPLLAALRGRHPGCVQVGGDLAQRVTPGPADAGSAAQPSAATSAAVRA